MKQPNDYICSHCFEPITGEESYSVIENGPLYCSPQCLLKDADHLGWVEAKIILEEAHERLMEDPGPNWYGMEEVEAAWHLNNAIAYVNEQIPEYLRVR